MNPTIFFDKIRASIFRPNLDEGQVTGCNALLKATNGLPTDFTAYALATAYHETAHSMQPINEYGGDSYFTRMYDILGNRPSLAREMGNTVAGDGIKYHGRGFVQLTWKCNYKKAAEKLNVNLVDSPDLALQPEYAGLILRHGMEEGWFSGKTLADYLTASGNSTEQQFIEARHIINGNDCAALIAGYAIEFRSALTAAS